MRTRATIVCERSPPIQLVRMKCAQAWHHVLRVDSDTSIHPADIPYSAQTVLSTAPIHPADKVQNHSSHQLCNCVLSNATIYPKFAQAQLTQLNCAFQIYKPPPLWRKALLKKISGKNPWRTEFYRTVCQHKRLPQVMLHTVGLHVQCSTDDKGEWFFCDVFSQWTLEMFYPKQSGKKYVCLQTHAVQTLVNLGHVHTTVASGRVLFVSTVNTSRGLLSKQNL